MIFFRNFILLIFLSFLGSFHVKLNSINMLSQTQTHIDTRSGNLSKYYNYDDSYSNLFDQIISKEKSLNSDYYVFYHGQKGAHRIIQDLLKKLSIKLKNYEEKDFEEFCYLRIPSNNFNKFNSMKDVFDSYPKANENDDNREILLDVNLSLFGNFGMEFSNSLYYFFNDFSCLEPPHFIENLLKEVFESFELKLEDQKLNSYINILLQLNDYIEIKEGNMIQVFIPKDKVNKYVYLDYVFNEDEKVEVRGPVFNVAETIDKYFLGKERFSFNTLNYFSGRILLNNDFMLDPKSGVKIFRYTTVSEDKMQKYNEDLDLLVDEILKNKEL